jgi:succinyl-CoA synthetase alpha subunit
MKRVRVERSVYLDSIALMGISRKLGSVPGVATAMVAMATDTNLLLLKENGFDLSGVGELSSGDLVIAIDARDEGSMAGAVAAAASQIAAGAAPPRPASGGTGPGTDGKALASFSLEGAFRDHPEINLVLISLPGKFAAREAEKALRAGRHVMIFSDNVSLEDEKRLKALAAERGLLVMGPDCGTAVIGGVGLGFANHLPPGPVGIVAASGTGAQEVSSILARMGIGVTHIIGTGGRDVTDAISGASTLAGLEALIADGPTRAIVIISKLPSPRVSEEVLRAASAGGKPCVIYFAGYSGEQRRGNLAFAGTLTEAALEAAGKLGETSEVARALGGRAAASSGKPASDQYAAWRGGEAAERVRPR